MEGPENWKQWQVSPCRREKTVTNLAQTLHPNQWEEFPTHTQKRWTLQFEKTNRSEKNNYHDTTSRLPSLTQSLPVASSYQGRSPAFLRRLRRPSPPSPYMPASTQIGGEGSEAEPSHLISSFS